MLSKRGARVSSLSSALLLATAVASALVAPTAAADDVLIFAAASLTNVLDAMKPLILKDTGVSVRALDMPRAPSWPGRSRLVPLPTSSSRPMWSG